jgi:hypothetical protein
MNVIRRLEAVGGDPARLTGAEQADYRFFTTNAGYRLRSEHQLQQEVQQFLTEIGQQDHALFQNLTQIERMRLYGIRGTGQFSGVDVRQEAAAYAIPRSGSVSEFAAHVEFYVTQLQDFAAQRVALYERAVRDQERALGRSLTDAERNDRRQEFFGRQDENAIPWLLQRGDVEGRIARAYAAARNLLGGQFGAQNIGANLSDADAITAIQRLTQSFYGTEPAAIYHAYKHENEIPPSEQDATNPVNGYMGSAMMTIQRPGRTEMSATQFGRARSISFFRTVGGQRLRAIVIYNPDTGVAVLATYGRN